MTTRQEVLRAVQAEGPGAARQRFGDAIVTDVLVKGVNAPTSVPTGDCACGGHHAAPRPTYDHAAVQGVIQGLTRVAADAAALSQRMVRHVQNRTAAQEAARRAELQRGIAVAHGRTFDHAAGARGRAASNSVHARQVAGPIATLNARNAEFWAKQAAGGAR